MSNWRGLLPFGKRWYDYGKSWKIIFFHGNLTTNGFCLLVCLFCSVLFYSVLFSVLFCFLLVYLFVKYMYILKYILCLWSWMMLLSILSMVENGWKWSQVVESGWKWLIVAYPHDVVLQVEKTIGYSWNIHEDIYIYIYIYIHN